MRSATQRLAMGCAMALCAYLSFQGGLIAMAAETTKPLPQYVYKTIGERKLTMDVDYPPDWKPGDQRPAIVFFFGGAWTSGTPGQFQPQAEYFAKRGLVCARADYRIKSKDGVMPDKCVEDAISAMRWVRANAKMLGIDPNRIVSSGGSAGGHLAACVYFTEGLNDPQDDLAVSPKPNAMILYNPALDLLALPESGRGSHTAGMSENAVAQISPLRHVNKDMPPTLLVDGTEDFFNKQVNEFIDKEKALGARVEGYFAEGQPHGFFNRPPWLQKTTQRADEFLQSIGYLKAEPKVELPSKPNAPANAQKGKAPGKQKGQKQKAPSTRPAKAAPVQDQ